MFLSVDMCVVFDSSELGFFFFFFPDIIKTDAAFKNLKRKKKKGTLRNSFCFIYAFAALVWAHLVAQSDPLSSVDGLLKVKDQSKSK